MELRLVFSGASLLIEDKAKRAVGIKVMAKVLFNLYWAPRLADPLPYLQTPFPEYTCGHSTCSSFAAAALMSVFGDNFAYTDITESMFGIKSRSYKSFKEAAKKITGPVFMAAFIFIIPA